MEIRKLTRSLPNRAALGAWIRRLTGAFRPLKNRGEFHDAIVISQAPDGRLDGVHVGGCNNGKESPPAVRDLRIGGPSPDAQADGSAAESPVATMAGCGKKGPVVLVLPKSHYLVKKLPAAAVAQDEMHGMLELAAEAALPPQFGPVEISYRRLKAQSGQAACCEVYISRREALEDCLRGLETLGVRPDYILPSAVVWQCALSGCVDTDLLVVRTSRDAAEAAGLCDDSACSVRRLMLTEGDPAGFHRQLIECIRSVNGKGVNPSAAVNVGCVGEIPACWVPKEAVVFRNVGHQFSSDDDGAGPTVPLSRMAGCVLREIASQGLLQTANLLPRRLTLGAKARGVRRRLCLSAAALLVALLGFDAALRIATARYRGVNEDLFQRISRIKTEGETVGWQMAQLESIQALRASGGDLLGVIGALAAGTPKEVSYSDVELTEDGAIRLRGQADSVSLPFLLPESLQKQAQFRRVALQSVGQKQQGAGAATDFRLDCILDRKDRKVARP
jgi:type II secretory pathway component PulL